MGVVFIGNAYPRVLGIRTPCANHQTARWVSLGVGHYAMGSGFEVRTTDGFETRVGAQGAVLSNKPGRQSNLRGAYARAMRRRGHDPSLPN